jgi:circadian clock protein KaiB
MSDASVMNGDDQVWSLCLYIAGENQKSRAALTNLNRLCESRLGAGCYKIEVIDLLQNPQQAKQDQILAIPTLVRKSPGPAIRVIGDLSDLERTVATLDLPGLAPAP